MKVVVGPEGPIDATIVGVGEAPATNEVFHGRPFVGSAGQYLDQYLKMAGINREEIYLTNIMKCRAPQDKIAKVPKQDLKDWTDNLIEELNELPNVKVFIAFGNYPMQALTGVNGITRMRGTPQKLRPEISHQDAVVVPTFHPSKVHYHWDSWPLIVADLAKANTYATKGFTWPTWTFHIDPSFDKVMKTLDWLRKEQHEIVVIDVETPRNMLSCIGLAWSRSEAICIPFFDGHGKNYWPKHDEYAIWGRLAEVLPKLNLAAQNALFDWRIMLEHGIHLSMPKWDSMLMHHCLYSELPHKLDVITSIYTDLPYYKTDEDEERGSKLTPGKEKEHWEYNCFDCIGCLWAIEELRKELEEEGMVEAYHALYTEVIPAIFRMNMSGIPVDVETLEKVQEEQKQLIEEKTKQLAEAAGHEVNPNSPKQVATLLYDELKFTKYKGESTAEKTLEKLAYKYKSEIPQLIIDIRKARKMLGLFSEENVVDGLVKCEYALHRTSTGRFASRKGRGRGGMNLQNVKRGEQRRFFVPPPGHIMICADQKNAEAMIVAWLAADEAMIALFDSGASLHLANAKNLFKEEITKDDARYRIAKACVHGGNYGIGPRKFALITGLPFAQAKEALEGYHSTYPGIRRNFHNYVRREIDKCRTLYNPFGRRQVFFGRKDTTTYQAGYAFIPQSTVSDINKTALKRINEHYRPLLETHDGLAIAVPEGELKYGLEAMQEAYEVSIKIWDVEHVVPIDVSYGSNWEDQEEVEL